MDQKSKPLTKKKNKFIDLEPTLNRVDGNLSETQLSTSQTDWLINHGLGQKDKLTFYRRAIQDPKGSVTNPQYRAYVGEVADRIFSLIWNDNQMFNRLKTLLQEKYHGNVDTNHYVIGEEAEPDPEEDDDDDDDKKKNKEEVSEVTLLRIRKMINKKV
jgi:hypothetical protein